MELGLSLKDFFALRPNELDAMAKLLRKDREGEQWRDACLMACIVNSGFSRPKDLVTPADFMPSAAEPRSGRRNSRKATAKHRADVADGLRGLLGAYMKAEGGSKAVQVDGDV